MKDKKNRDISEEDKNTLDHLIAKHTRILLDKPDKNVKIGDLIKLMAFRMKLAPGDTDRKKLLQLLEKVRREKLAEDDSTPPKEKKTIKEKVAPEK